MKRVPLWGAAVLAALWTPAAAEAACSVSRVVELPVTLANGFRPTVQARINGMEARFIVDSGAFYSLVSPGMAKATGLRLTPAPVGFRLSGIGGDTNASVAWVEDLKLAGVQFPRMQFLVGGSDTGTAGLLGQNVLGFADVEYDLPHGMIRLFRSRDCAKASLAYWAGEGVGFSIVKIEPLIDAHYHTVGIVYVDGKPLRAMFDTGATGTALSRKAAERLGVSPGSPGVTEGAPSHGLGQKMVRRWMGSFKSVRFGDEELHNVRLGISDTEFSQADMLVGADFFLSHRVYVDNASHRLFLTYTGGRIFGNEAREEGATQAAAPAAAAEAAAPTDAEGFSRRGAVFLAQRDLPRAIADFSRAVELSPREPRFLVQRAEAYFRSGRRGLAAADLNRALEIDPANVPARLQRAQLRSSIAEKDAALADLDAAAAAIRGPLNERLALASGYGALGAYEKAVAQYDVWIKAHPEDSALAGALNGRCWARALWGRELDKALSDCNGALRLRPKTPSYLDSRGVVRLRLGDYDRAVTDFDAALAANPKLAWSLYGRGLARRHKGLTAEGEADLKAALAMAPDIAERARRAGIE